MLVVTVLDAAGVVAWRLVSLTVVGAMVVGAMVVVVEVEYVLTSTA